MRAGGRMELGAMQIGELHNSAAYGNKDHNNDGNIDSVAVESDR